MNKGKIILLNGVSSSGKSTLSKELIKKLPDFFHFSIDDYDFIIEKMEDRVNERLIPVETEYFYHQNVKMFTDKGIDLILDHILHDRFTKEDFFKTLNGYPVLLVGVHCPLEEVERREKERGDRPVGQARRQLDYVHKNIKYNIEVDTFLDSQDECLARIVEALNKRRSNMIEQDKLMIRKLEIEDASFLSKWLSDPIVLEYYEGRDRPHDLNLVKQVFFSKDENLTPCLILFENTPIGYLQFYPIDKEEKHEFGYESELIVYGMDQFIGEPSYWNKGIGASLISAVTEYLFQEKNAEVIIMDPQVRNKRALRCYEKCGFKIVKILPENELHEGKMEDCYLIEKRCTN